jgi:hypothetical protein
MDEQAQSAADESSRKQASPVGGANNPATEQVATERRLQEVEQKIDLRMSAFERSMIRLTWAAVVISALSFLVFGGQLYEMISGGTQTDKIIAADGAMVAQEQRLADNSQKILDAGNTQSKENIAALQSAQRAWLGIGDVDVTQFSEGKPVRVNIHIVNSGKTPPINSKQEAGFAVGNKPNPPAKFNPFSHSISGNIVPPGGSTILTIGLSWDTIKSDYRAILANQLALFVFVNITYDDVYGGHHKTKSCLRMEDANHFVFCEGGNTMD